ncbi:Major facilitator superfamily domain general substrate transporter, partial [Penicillium atrosanguineum]
RLVPWRHYRPGQVKGTSITCPVDAYSGEHLAGLFVGRLFQSIVSNGLFIVSLAALAENLGPEHMGKIAKLLSTLSAAGTFAGPVIAAFLFGFGKYWTAWAGAFTFLVVDIIMRLLMIEKPSHNTDSGKPKSQNEASSEPAVTVTKVQGWRFYVFLLQQPRFSAGFFCYFVFYLLIASFQTTFAILLRAVLGWGVFPVGLLFAALQGPGMILSPLMGWLKNREGSRTPITLGFLSLAPVLWLLGAAGDGRFPWATIGSLICLLKGVGTMEANKTIDSLETRYPGVFGKGRGFSPAIALTGMSWMTGLLVGPILAGVVVEQFEFPKPQLILTLTSILTGLVAAFNLNSTVREKPGPSND